MKPYVGLIALYTLSDYDALIINQRSGGGDGVIAVPAQAGEVLPFIITRILSASDNGGHEAVNGQLLADGNFSLWVSDVIESDKPCKGQWHRRELPATARLMSFERLPASPLQTGSAMLKEDWPDGPVSAEARHMRSLYDAETMARLLSSKLETLPATTVRVVECQRLAQLLHRHLCNAQVTPA